MKALDLFCCAGGASTGLRQAGFAVTGVDIDPQPNYPFRFIQANALGLSIDFLRGFDFIWASPPCQFATAYKRRGPNHVPDSHPNLIPLTRALLSFTGVPFVIENVDQRQARAELREPVRLCGSHFGLDVQRHRLFEAHGFSIPQPTCDHSIWTPRFPPAGNRTNLRRTCEIGVWRIPLDVQVAAMGGDLAYMSRPELSQAIPPSYARFIAQAAQGALSRPYADQPLPIALRLS